MFVRVSASGLQCLSSPRREYAPWSSTSGTGAKAPRKRVAPGPRQPDPGSEAAGAGIWTWNMVTGNSLGRRNFFRLSVSDPGRDTATVETWRQARGPSRRSGGSRKPASTRSPGEYCPTNTVCPWLLASCAGFPSAVRAMTSQAALAMRGGYLHRHHRAQGNRGGTERRAVRQLKELAAIHLDALENERKFLSRELPRRGGAVLAASSSPSNPCAASSPATPPRSPICVLPSVSWPVWWISPKTSPADCGRRFWTTWAWPPVCAGTSASFPGRVPHPAARASHWQPALSAPTGNGRLSNGPEAVSNVPGATPRRGPSSSACG